MAKAPQGKATGKAPVWKSKWPSNGDLHPLSSTCNLPSSKVFGKAAEEAGSEAMVRQGGQELPEVARS